jgi:hypothetical protein
MTHEQQEFILSTISWDEMDLQPFDDGHIPENLTTSHPNTRMVDHPLFHRPAAAAGALAARGVHVYQDALPEQLVDRAYQKTLASKHPSWGEYVTIPQIQDYWNGTLDGTDETTTTTTTTTGCDDVTIALAAEFLALTLGKSSQHHQPSLTIRRLEGHDNDADDATTAAEPLWTDDDLELAHGVAVWALRATVGSQVPYHLDYAEQVRYQSNVIVPPLVAGTLQCSRAKITGGDFVVAAVPNGLDHYAKHGYKAKFAEPNDMVSIPYRFNQVTCHLGDLPHASTKVEAIQGDDDHCAVRVIVGFNVFPHAIGPVVQQAPEHSDAFRRLVTTTGRRRSSSSSKNGLSLERVKENKALSRLLVLAKRQKVQEDFRLAQDRLDREIPKCLPATVQELMDRFYVPGTVQWPASPTDVQVYLDHQIHRGGFRVLLDGGPTIPTNDRDLVSPETMIGLIGVPQTTKIDETLSEQ